MSRHLRTPAGRSVVVQCGALTGTMLIAFVCGKAGWQLSILTCVLLQASLATADAWRLRMAVWWRCIHFVFPIAVALALAAQLPSGFYLSGFVVLALLFWTTFKTQVPYYPSSVDVHERLLTLVPRDSHAQVIDIGSGLGGLVMHLAAQRPGARCSGIEVAPLPWLLSVLRAYCKGSRARFLRGDYLRLDLAQYDLVFAYLSPAAMPQLWQKACAEMRPGSLLVSHEFAIPGVTPMRTLPSGARAPRTYVYHIGDHSRI